MISEIVQLQFGLDSLFNGILIFVGYFMLKPSLENNCDAV